MPESTDNPRIVVAAVIEGDGGRWLVARRPAGSHLEGLWEFPGGAVEAGERAEDALVRELHEELAAEIRVGDPLTFAWHHDHRRTVLLLFYRARIVSGTPVGQQGQEVRWVTGDEMRDLPTPPADAELIRRLVAREV